MSISVASWTAGQLLELLGKVAPGERRGWTERIRPAWIPSPRGPLDAAPRPGDSRPGGSGPGDSQRGGSGAADPGAESGPHRRECRRRAARALADYVDPAELRTELAEVLVWTSADGAWQEHATFLLRMRDGDLHAIAFGEPAGAELALWLRQLPGCDTDLLCEVIGQPVRRIVTIWRRADNPGGGA
jgi:hypothetical protein